MSGQPILAVGAVVGEGLAGPLPRDQDPAAAVAEVLAAVCLALAAPGRSLVRGFLGWMP